MIEFSLLCLQHSQMTAKLEHILPVVDAVHLDIMEPPFVPNTAFSPAFVNAFRTTLPKHVHVMAFDPVRYLDHLTDVSSFSFHIEAVPHPLPVIDHIRGRGVAPGIAINPDTSISHVRPLLADISRVILMAVPPGFSGRTYLPATSRKLLELRQLSPDVEIVIDGGIQTDTLREVMTLGADAGVVCSVIVQADDPLQKILELKHAGMLGKAHRQDVRPAMAGMRRREQAA
jgi:ribulose-phosphate 3-epimerase